jgi:DNA-binding PadR family transcriptional regulator
MEGLLVAADPLEHVQGGAFRAMQRTRRKDGEVSCEVRQFRVQFSPQVFDKLACRALYIGYQRITLLLHTRIEIIQATRSPVRMAEQRSTGASLAILGLLLNISYDIFTNVLRYMKAHALFGDFWMHFDDERFGGAGRHGRGGRRHGLMGRLSGFMGGAGFRAARMLASGDLQLIVLALLREKPRHGYEIIKALEERSYGVYTPSPGVVYPALTYLEETGHAVCEAEGNKKLFRITDSGREYLAKNQDVVDETLEQLSLFGRKMARMHRHFAEEEAENDFDYESPRSGRDEWRKLKVEFRELKEELRAALREKIDSSPEEKKRILAILKNALREIRGR